MTEVNPAALSPEQPPTSSSPGRVDNPEILTPTRASWHGKNKQHEAPRPMVKPIVNLAAQLDACAKSIQNSAEISDEVARAFSRAIEINVSLVSRAMRMEVNVFDPAIKRSLAEAAELCDVILRLDRTHS